MWHTNESDWGRRRLHRRPESRWMQKMLELLCGAVVAVMLPFAAGCSPEWLVGGAIVGSVLYAHVNQESLPPRPQPVLQEPRTYDSDRRGASRAYTPNRPPVQRTVSRSKEQGDMASSIMEGCRAYWELRWEDAVRILSRAIDTGTCTPSEQGRAHLLLGAIAYQQGDAETARRHFIRAHRHDPQLQPSPELFPPPLIEFYKNARGP